MNLSTAIPRNHAVPGAATPLPIVIYQMGKVGSSTIVSTLERSKIGRRVEHVHYLNEDTLEGIARLHTDAGKRIPKHVLAARSLKGEIAQRNGVLDIITAVRDPIARNISSFFQNIELKIGRDVLLQRNAESALAAVSEMFIKSYNHDIPLSWFDHEMRKSLGIDVYAQPFPHAAGYQIIRTPEVNLLIVRLEDFNRIGAEALQSFLNTGGIRLFNRNTAATKWYADLYAEFRSALRLPQELIGRMYSSKFMQHFYTAAEISQFSARWQR